MPSGPELQPVQARHAAVILAFESANRAYFSASISDRGDEYFDHFAGKHEALLARQETGVDACYVLVDGGSVLGRFNLVDIRDGRAELGYRVAQRVAGRGVATAAVRQLCGLARMRHGIDVLRARTTLENLASQRVLVKVGFTPVGDADVAGRPGTWFERTLSPDAGPGVGDARGP